MANALIVIPTYNEKDNIEKLIGEIFRYAPGIEALIVDDDSPDGTGDIADKIASLDKRVSVIHRMRDKGRGAAGVEGFKAAVKREDISYVMEMDADFSHDPRYIPDFLKEIIHNDIVIGSRFVKEGGDTERDLLRRLLSKAVNFLIRSYLGLGVRDCSSGYRCFKKEIIAQLNLDSLISKGPAILEETLYIAHLKKYKIKEIPIFFKNRYKNKTKLNLIKLLRVGVDMVVFKKIYLPENIK
jgi:dolichol-phosphate mannosyltransferase